MKIIDTVGGTPLVEISSGVASPSVRLYGKLEGNNPAGSVKDRPGPGDDLGTRGPRALAQGVRP